MGQGYFIDSNDRQRLQELYAYGESIAAKNNFTEEDVFKEIKEYRKNIGIKRIKNKNN
jgi:hypothetical protein